MIKVTAHGLRQWGQILRKEIGVARAKTRDAVGLSTRAVETGARNRSPSASGTLGRSVTSYYELAGMRGVVEVRAPYAPWVEGVYHEYTMGRAPGRWPPFELDDKGHPFCRVILDWMILKGIGVGLNRSEQEGIAYVIARKIGLKGTPAQPFLKPAFEAEQPRFTERMRKIGTDFAAKMNSVRALRGAP